LGLRFDYSLFKDALRTADFVGRWRV